MEFQRQHAGRRGQELIRRVGRAAWLLLAPAVLWAAGCYTLPTFGPAADKPPTGQACQVVATWMRDVVTTADVVHGGTPMPGLAGRVYLFGPDVDYPLAGDGGLVVDLYDDGHPIPDKGPPLIEEWRIDPATLHRLLKRDAIGWGYTVFLPFAKARPELTRVHTRVCYQPPQGSPLYAEGASMTIGAGDAAAGPAVAGRGQKVVR
jgi:hypothetical protein